MIEAPGKNPNGHTWCGPYALALLAGVPYERAYGVLLAHERKAWRAYNRRAGTKHPLPKRIARVTARELAAGGKTLGVKIDWLEFKKRPTLGAFLRDHTTARDFYLIFITGHFLLFDARTQMVCDNNTARWVDPLTRRKYLRCRVKSWAISTPKSMTK